MSVRAMSDVFEASGLTPVLKLVLLALADHANDDGRSIYPSVQTIMRKTALAERTVRQALSELRKMRLLIVTRYSNQHQPTEYAINLRLLKSLVQAVEEVPEPPPGVQEMQVCDDPEVQVVQVSEIRGAPDAGLENPGVHVVQSRGACGAPKPSINHQILSSSRGENRQPVVSKIETIFGITLSPAQEKEIGKLIELYKPDLVFEALNWYQAQGDKVDRAIKRAKIALPTWNPRKPPKDPAKQNQKTNQAGETVDDMLNRLKKQAEGAYGYGT